MQRRYARKDGHVYTHAGGVGHLRDDYYHVWGGTFSVGYYLTESLALESSVLAVRSIPSSAARRIRRATGYVPDSEPQDVWLLTGARYSFGYAKALLFETALAHFDPQLFAQLGAARGQSRWMPTMSIGAGALAHLPFNIQVRLDLGMTVQLEKRTRGWVGSVGFLPQLTVGWAFDVASLWQEEAAG